MATKGKLNVDFAMRYVGAIGANRYVANVNRYSTIAWKDIVYYAARAAHVPESSIEVAMDALFDALNYFVLNGHNVKIDGIGTFYFGINAGAEESEAKAGASSVKRLKIGFLPEMTLRQALNNVAVTTTTSNPGNLFVDQSVPPLIRGLFVSATSNGEFFQRSFGAEVKLIGKEIYLRLYGQRMRRQLDLVVGVSAVKDGEEVGDVEVTATPIGVTAQYAAYHITAEPSASDYDQLYLDSVYAEEPGNPENIYFFRHFTHPGGYAMASMIVANGKNFLLEHGYGEVPVFNAPAAEKNTLEIYGANLQQFVDNLGVQNVTATLKRSGNTLVIYDISGVTAEPAFLQLNSGIRVAYPAADGVPTVTSLTANGVSVSNNSSSTIRQGESYNFVFSGSNLGGLTAGNLNVPSGSTISNFAASANKVSFTMGNAQAGVISLVSDGTTLFSVTVTEYSGGGEGEVTVTTVGGLSNNATYDVTGKSTMEETVMAVVGTGLSSLSKTDFKQMRGNSVISNITFKLDEGSDTERDMRWSGSFSSGDKLVIQKDGTTLFTLNITGSMVAEY